MILPFEATGEHRPWSRDHHRLHRHLKRNPALLPPEAPLLLAVSGGQDSMTLAALLKDLRHLHGWSLHLWHGNHGWRPEAGDHALALGAWCQEQDLPLVVDRAEPSAKGEARAREWRLSCLQRLARELGCGHVVTGHTASDRAETVLLNLARGCHQRGLASLRASRSLGSGTELSLVRPLLLFSRADTARFCRENGIPVWKDSSNDDLRYRRNRLRHEVLPVLEAIHPGASHRISAQAHRLADDLDQAEELASLALVALEAPAAEDESSLWRRDLMALGTASQRRLLQHWLGLRLGHPMAADWIEGLIARLPPERGQGRQNLPGGWQLRWDRSTITLLPPHRFHG